MQLGTVDIMMVPIMEYTRKDFPDKAFIRPQSDPGVNLSKNWTKFLAMLCGLKKIKKLYPS